MVILQKVEAVKAMVGEGLEEEEGHSQDESGAGKC